MKVLSEFAFYNSTQGASSEYIQTENANYLHAVCHLAADINM